MTPRGQAEAMCWKWARRIDAESGKPLWSDDEREEYFKWPDVEEQVADIAAVLTDAEADQRCEEHGGVNVWCNECIKIDQDHWRAKVTHAEAERDAAMAGWNEARVLNNELAEALSRIRPTVAHAEAERDEARAWLKERTNTKYLAEDEVERLQAHVEALAGALEKYGRHKPVCSSGASAKRRRPCDCGLEAALAAYRAAPPPPRER